MTCESIAPLLDDYIDGTLTPESRATVEAHLAGCKSCQAEVAALRSILADARALPRSVMPARDLWVGIEGRLGGSAARPMVAPSVARETIRRISPRARAVLLAAAAVLLLLGGTLIGRLLTPVAQPNGTFATEQRRYTEATATLARQLANDHSLLPQETRAVVERNLAIVDEAIKEAELALTSDPGNTALEQMVLARYQQRLALLKRATDAGRRES